MEELGRLGIRADKDTVEFCSERGSVAFLLDAFDEVREADRAAHVDELEGIARKFPTVRLVITARPGSTVAASAAFERYSLAELNADDIPNVIKRLVDGDEAKLILKSLGQAGSNIVDMLRTPLLVSLMVFRFRVDQSIPETIALFYEDVFDVMLRRHDRSKPGGGVDRLRTSGLGDATMRRVFDAFCFATARDEQQIMPLNTAWRYAAEAIRDSDADAEPSAWIDDICSITCLLIEEAGEIRFLHKTVQEYHAAAFVRGVSDSRAASFYERMSSQWRDWYQTLVFLEEIDRDRFLVGFGLPELERAHGYQPGQHVPDLATILECCDVSIQRDSSKPSVELQFWYQNYWIRRAEPSLAGRGRTLIEGDDGYIELERLAGHKVESSLTEMELSAIQEYVIEWFTRLTVDEPFYHRWIRSRAK